MNVDNLPWAHTDVGFPALMAFMTVVCAFLYWRFRDAGWL
jgi:Mg2+ and Co2+ transporter CorA